MRGLIFTHKTGEEPPCKLFEKTPGVHHEARYRNITVRPYAARCAHGESHRAAVKSGASISAGIDHAGLPVAGLQVATHVRDCLANDLDLGSE